MENPRTILIIEDNEVVQAETQSFLKTRYRMLGREVNIIEARTAEDGLKAVNKHCHEIDIILLDGCLDGNEPDGLQLIPEILAIYSGPILAMSKSPELRDMMIKAGATHQSEKPYATGVAISILEPQTAAA